MTKLSEIKNNASKIQLERLSFVYFEHEDLNAFEKFAADFGLVEAWRGKEVILYRGYGRDQFCYVARKAGPGGTKFGGPAFVAQTQADLDKAAALEGAQLNSLDPFPGGGRQVTLKTPAGFYLHIIFGQEDRPAANTAPSRVVENQGPLNGSINKRRFGEFQRYVSGPALVHKLGHCGYNVGNWDEEVEWYCSQFNIVPSDVQYSPKNPDLDVITFLHLDLGERYSDHHSLFLARAMPGEHNHMHHTSYEVEDFDTQLLGHQWLANKGHYALWGVGRHILGSQIFDYWRDPSGFTIEHYADGDLVNIHTGTQRSAAGAFAVWGPEIPKDFSADGTKFHRANSTSDASESVKFTATNGEAAKVG
ncbi:uncharacterized protein Z518_08892 [Rhinocladiella mackenziei CBS 650.93]|uniref:VOC domain-containing protein n=1 Tax=Rhinocladiella mackenziei CBS 650.93 TaxID=1442369 RepID=A0A0D2FGN5_9EURO|nr:uncharacterized protein Z518_08892 [Rhinocladiella mackenziei CBS 650.93]KIX01167.1 hypothetical protein Z518_08892 [Rhinocladiella mackenziei CBS 650.93]